MSHFSIHFAYSLIHWTALLLMGVSTTIPPIVTRVGISIRILQRRWEVQIEQEKQYSRYHHTQNLQDLPDNTPVHVITNNTIEPGTVVAPARTPRSCIAETSNGQVRRNQQHLTPMLTVQHDMIVQSRTGKELVQ